MSDEVVHQNINKLNITSVSFACGGWLQFYLFGVAKAMQKHNIYDGVSFAGCSAGALTAAGIALKGNFDDAVNFCKESCIPQCYGSIKGPFQLEEYVSSSLDLTCNLHNWVHLTPGKLHIAITKLPSLSGLRRTEYESREDLKNCLLGSAAAFPFAKLQYHNGSWLVDGGITDFQPLVDENTITVSPFYFNDVDIKPSRFIPLLWALFPPNCNDTVDWLYNLGYTDGLAWLEKRHAMINSVGSNAAQETVEETERKAHPYDIFHHKISWHRFLGFDISNYTNSYVLMFLDLCLLFLVLFVYKPFALCLIYMELYLIILKNSLLTIYYELVDIIPMISLCFGLLSTNYLMIILLSTLTYVTKVIVVGPANYNNNLTNMMNCIRCLCSLSLLKRFFPAVFPYDFKHSEMLSKLSFTYRVVKHMV